MAVALRSEKRSGSAKALPDHFMPRIRRGFPVIRPGTARLHPKGTSSRFALRAPRRLAPHNDKSGAITVLTGACTSRQRCAGSGMPLPYNSGCGRRNCFKICNCQWRSGSAATVKSVSTHVRRCPVHLGRPLLRLPRRFAPRNDKSGAITVLTGACTSRQRCAGSGMPLPYNSGCGRRNCFKICNCQWRSGSAATDAIGLYVFVGSPFESAAVRRAGLSPPIQHLTILRRPYFTYAARNCRVRSFFGWRNSSSGVPDSATTPRSRKMT